MTMFKQVFDLDSCVESHVGKLCMKGSYYTQSMGGSIQKVWIAKSDMANTLCCLCSDVCQYNMGRYSKETSVIDWCNWTMEAGMFAASCFLSVPGKCLFSL